MPSKASRGGCKPGGRRRVHGAPRARGNSMAQYPATDAPVKESKWRVFAQEGWHRSHLSPGDGGLRFLSEEGRRAAPGLRRDDKEVFTMSEVQAAKPEKKPIIFSGIQPSGTLTLGNYIGALKNFSALQDDYDCIYCIVDMHAITVRQNPADLRRRCMELAAIYIASGLDPKKSLIYCQSHVSGHAELAWILNCFTYMGELSRMTQYKDKCAKHADNINAGLFTYPVLMAADILLYQTNLVPVGVDQKQHLELCRDIAQRFNGVYGDVFTVPEGYIPKVGSKIMSLQEPTRKMSKSDPEETFVAILDDPDTIRRKIKRAVTDSDGEIRYDPENKPGVSNLLSIMSALGAGSIDSIAAEMAGQGYGALKTRTADCVIAALEPLQQEYKRLIADKAYLQGVLDENAKTANYLATKTLRKVQKKVGFASRG